jgi:hypothetical protein
MLSIVGLKPLHVLHLLIQSDTSLIIYSHVYAHAVEYEWHVRRIFKHAQNNRWEFQSYRTAFN